MGMIDIAPAPAVERQFDMSRVVRRTFSLIRRDWLTFGLLAAVLVGAPQVVWSLAVQQYGLRYPAGSGMFSSPWYWAIFLLSQVGGALAEGAIISGVSAKMAGERPAFWPCLASSLRIFAPVFVINLLGGLGVIVGCAFLIVPGLWLAMTWMVAAPAQIVERTGVWKAFGRSAELTDGAKGPILGLTLAYYLPLVILAFLVNVLDKALLALHVQPWTTLAAATVAGVELTITTVVSYAGLASIYVELRSWRDAGMGSARLADVFD